MKFDILFFILYYFRTVTVCLFLLKIAILGIKKTAKFEVRMNIQQDDGLHSGNLVWSTRFLLLLVQFAVKFKFIFTLT